MSEKFDLVVIGAGCVGMAAAYYALKMNRRVCVIERNEVGDERKFWSQSYVARQMRLQHNEEYMTRFMKMSMDEWKLIEQDLAKETPFFHREGSLWFGDKHVNTLEGNIKNANQTLIQINSCMSEGQKKIESLYMDRLIQESPEFMKAFKPEHNQWDSWSGLYQPDGGSLNMKASYEGFYHYIKSQGDRAVVIDKTTVVKHETSKNDFKHKFTTSSKQVVQARSVFICTGVYTPYFLKEVMHYPHLVDNNYKEPHSHREYSIQEYVSSYFKVEEGQESYYSRIPAFINFISENPHERNFTTFGFPLHRWDTVKQGDFVKIGTMDRRRFHSCEEESKFLKNTQFQKVSEQDHRVHSAINYVMKRMNGVNAKSPMNRHYPYPMIFYEGRQTLLDYMQRKDESVVVQSGGWMSNEYPLIAKTVVRMLFEPQTIRKERQEMTVIGSFLNRTRFPLKSYVDDRLNKLNHQYPKNGEFKTVVVGAGCSGMYSAFRMSQCQKDSLGVFDLSERIGGGLKSFQIRTTTTTPFELEEIKYIPSKHGIVNELVMSLGIPNIPSPPQTTLMHPSMSMSKMNTEGQSMMDWNAKQSEMMESTMMPSFKIKGHLQGMSAFQIISFSLFQILTAPENIAVLTEVFLMKTKEEIRMQKERMNCCGQTPPPSDCYYRNWQNYVYRQKQNPLSYCINLSLSQWNTIAPLLLFRFPYSVTEKELYQCQPKLQISEVFPLYKFGFQNVLETQFGHQAYRFISEQDSSYSTGNASYIDQVMACVMDSRESCRILVGGFENINYAMANELVDEERGLWCKNGGIYLAHKLVNIEKTDNKYLLTFHLKNQNTPVPLDDPFKSQLLSGVKKAKLYNLIHKGLGVPVPLPDKPGYSSIQFLTGSLILAMPKKAIEMLYNEIDLLNEPISTYQQFYKSDRRQYQALLNYPNLKEQMMKAKKFSPLTSPEMCEMQKLVKKQETGCELPPPQTKKLTELSERSFYNKLMTSSSMNMSYEQEKLKRFAEDPPLVPKSLCSLTSATQCVPAVRIMMNFSNNWWDPLRTITFPCIHSKAIQQIRGICSTDMLNTHTLQLSMGQDNLLLCSFQDCNTSQFWFTLHNNFEKVWHPKTDLLKQMKQGTCSRLISCAPSEGIYPAKEATVREILKELSRVYNTPVKEEWLKECVYQFMGNENSGTTHHFLSGYYTPSIMQTIRRPWKDESIHLAGQAYSNMSRWVEGSLMSTEMLLEREFGMPPMVKGYYAGY